MARRVRCSRCGVQMLVSPEARAVRCSMCHAVTDLVMINARPGRIGYDGYHGAPRMHGYSYMNGPQPRPPQPQPSLSPVPVHGRKRALLCGVNYHGKSYKLRGSINDAKCMKHLLVEKLGFPNESILMLTEEERDPLKIPTKQNIRKALRWLVYGCQPGDSLVFHFSGHGTRQKDYNQDEVDEFDEALCPLDHETEGNIIDDEINDTIVKPLTRGTTLHGIIDACYSGTVLDLPFVCRMNEKGYMWEDQTNPFFYKRTSGGLAVCVSACDDHQTSADTTAFTGSKKRTGAMTFSFVQAVQNEPRLTYGSLLNAMRSVIRGVSEAMDGATQDPQLTSSERFDIYKKPFVL
ncbi:Metacaspase-3 [Hibiscus syriacus]|uniref:Metacaspase-3 n=1 Tax=Hibiscus syriacus TaxID=106335 RepID=A0A6A2X0I9_HIBSY|nr:metacaspase-3-like [Hibiscus syriacus]KAE8667898.1 Metacaspase-3 [Hibiscus syriacus]